MTINPYSPDKKNEWDAFVKRAKNLHFIFFRDFMEYHSDRFQDFSLMVYENNKLIALLPSNLKNDVLFSHGGLTFGGFVVSDSMRTETMSEIFNLLKDYLRERKIEKLIYKALPCIFHKYPAEEDRYALFVNEAKLFRRDVSSAIILGDKPKYSKGRKWIINKAKKENLIISQSDDYDSYWELLTDVLKKNHGVKPVHSLEEIKRLSNLFPDNIKLFVSKKGNNLLAGSVIFENETIVHTQYLANSDEGREIGALDVVVDYLINETYRDKKYLSFGASTEQEGRYLNKGLIAQKEGFGAGAVVHDFYELEIN
ncbi:MAG: GNAT family N-acetyltransferase [Nitrospirae bacterium]|nr:GNAT family N-acetyltransferase [Nitrospirota bacterium]